MESQYLQGTKRFRLWTQVLPFSFLESVKVCLACCIMLTRVCGTGIPLTADPGNNPVKGLRLHDFNIFNHALNASERTSAQGGQLQGNVLSWEETIPSTV